MSISGCHVINDNVDYDIPENGFADDENFIVVFGWDNISSADEKTGRLSEQEEKIARIIDKQPYFSLINKAIELEKLHMKDKVSKGFLSVEWDIDRYWYEKTIKLTANPYADIIPESGFGFK